MTQITGGLTLAGHHLAKDVDRLREDIMGMAGGRVDICDDDGNLKETQEIFG